jgi:hypothetical protein
MTKGTVQIVTKAGIDTLIVRLEDYDQYVDAVDDAILMLRRMGSILKYLIGHSNCYCPICKAWADSWWTPKCAGERDIADGEADKECPMDDGEGEVSEEEFRLVMAYTGWNRETAGNAIRQWKRGDPHWSAEGIRVYFKRRRRRDDDTSSGES